LDGFGTCGQQQHRAKDRVAPTVRERIRQGTIAFLCADREFLGKRWVGWLVQESVPFRLRVKADTLLANGRGEMVCADWLFRDCPVQSERQLPHPRRCLGQQVFVCGTRLADGEFLIVIADDARACLADYGKRWGIETLFGALKRRGFNLEATHVTASDRLCRLLTLLSIAFCWAFAAGRWLTEQKPLRLAKRKKHGRKAIGVFRLGFDWLRRLLLPLSGLFRQADYQFALRFFPVLREPSRKPYPTDVSDQEWEFVAPYLTLMSLKRRNESTTCAKSSTRYAGSCEPVRPGDYCLTTSHPGKPCTSKHKDGSRPAASKTWSMT
jgi:hypothetical protein